MKAIKTKTQITKEQEPKIIELLEAARAAMIESWDRQRDIEILIGGDLDGLGDFIQYRAVGDCVDNLDDFYLTFRELVEPEKGSDHES